MNATTTEILKTLGDNPTMAKTLSTAAKLDAAGDDGLTAIRYAILRNITVEPGLPAAIKVAAAQTGLKAAVHLGEFDAAQQEAGDAAGPIYGFKPDVIVVALRLHTLAPRLVSSFTALGTPEIDGLVEATLRRISSVLTTLREHTTAMILVHNFELPAAPGFGILDPQLPHGQHGVIRALNAHITQCAAAIDACFVIDVDHLLATAGYEASLDDRYWHIGRAPYSFLFLQRLAREYVKFAAALKGKAKKCLVLDCDNTLWGGVVGEEGLNGIKLGATYPGSAYVAFQSAILDFYNRGVLLAINSKNNYADAYSVFERHPDSLLRPEHFVSLQINWEDKVANLRNIAHELNIGLDSLVFVDDNAFECQFVRETLPEVTVIELPAEPTRYERLLRAFGGFDTLALSEEDRRRSSMYRSQARRSELKTASGTIDDYLASLQMVLTISRANDFSVPRIAQLTQKTNQFNLTTRRYSEGDIASMMSDRAWHLYYAELEDMFDKAGIIAVALVHDNGDVARVDSLLMSCRVIGRGVETALLQYIGKDAFKRGRLLLTGEYVPTAKNELVKDFFEAAGFTQRPGSDGRWWDLDAQAPARTAPTWFREIRTTDEMVAV